MTTVNFHNLERAEKDRAVCRLAHQYYEGGRKVLVLVGSEEQAKRLDALLWTFSQSSFIPHRTWDDGSDPGLDRVLIARDQKRPEDFDVLILGAPASPPFLRNFTEVADFAEKHDPELLAESRKRYKECQAAGLSVRFVQKPLEVTSDSSSEE